MATTEEALEELLRLKAKVAAALDENADAQTAAEGATVASRLAGDRAHAASTAAADAATYIGEVRGGLEKVDAKLDELIDELTGNPPPIDPPPGDPWALRSWPEPVVAGEVMDVHSRAEWGEAWRALKGHDLIRIMRDPGVPLIGRDQHFAAGTNPWIWVHDDVTLEHARGSGWAGIDLINCSHINVSNVRQVGGDYAVRFSGVQGSAASPCLVRGVDGRDTRRAKLTIQDGQQWGFTRVSAFVDFSDIYASGFYAPDKPHFSEGVYLSNSRGQVDRTHSITGRRIHGHSLGSELLEMKPCLVDSSFEYVQGEDFYWPSDRTGPTGAISCLISGSGGPAPTMVRPGANISVRNVRLRGVRSQGHGAISVGVGGVTLTDLEIDDHDSAAVRYWSKRQPAPDGVTPDPIRIARARFSGQGPARAWSPEPRPVVELDDVQTNLGNVPW